MITSQELIQLRAFARQDGAILGLAWIVSFICAMQSLHVPLLALVSNLLALSTPFLVGYRLGKFRDEALGGVISFRRAFGYCIQTFAYATLLLTVTQFVYLRFIDAAYLEQFVITYRQLLESTPDIGKEDAMQITEALSGLTPLAWVSAFMITDILTGLFLSPFIALFGHRRLNKHTLHP